MTERIRSILVPILAAGLFFIVTALALQESNPLVSYPSLDGGYYLYVGQQIVNGQLPYHDVWESKPPGIFYVNALGLILGRGTRWGVWAIQFAFLFASALIGFQVMRKKYGLLPALLGSLAWVWGFTHLTSGGGYTEEFSLLFSFIAILAFWKSQDAPARFWDFLIGLTFAINFLFRANNTGVQVSIVVAWLLLAALAHDFSQVGRRLLWCGLGIFAGLGAAALFLGFQGILQEAINAAILYNFYITGEHINTFSSLVIGISMIQVPAGFMLIGYLALLNQQVEQRKPELLGLFLLVDLPLEIVLSGLSGRNYFHYFIPWLPVVGFLSAFLVSLVAQKLNQFAERFSAYTVLSGLLLLLVFSSSRLAAFQPVIQRLTLERNLGIELDHPVANYIRAHSDPTDKILIWGSELGLAYMAHRQEPTAYIFYPLYVPSPFTPHITSTYYQDLLHNPPLLIVDSYPTNPDLLPALDADIRRAQIRSTKIWPYLPDNIDQVLDFISTHYYLETVINGYRIYHYNGK